MSPLWRCSCAWAAHGHSDRVAVHLLEVPTLHSLSHVCAVTLHSPLVVARQQYIPYPLSFSNGRSLVDSPTTPLSKCQRRASNQLRQTGFLRPHKLLSLHFRFAGQHDATNTQQGLFNLFEGSRSAAAEVQSLALHLHCGWTSVATPSTRNVLVPQSSRLAQAGPRASEHNACEPRGASTGNGTDPSGRLRATLRNKRQGVSVHHCITLRQLLCSNGCRGYNTQVS
jgi:hypothetical protein